MNHKVTSVSDLYTSAKNLFEHGVVNDEISSADTIITNISSGIEILKNCWKGKDAGVQIQNLIVVHNAMVGIRNVLGSLSVDASKIASNYREIQNANGAGLEVLTPLAIEPRSTLENYSDVLDTISITSEAKEGKVKVDAANGAMDQFISTVQNYYDEIMTNWTIGTGREEAENAFSTFMNHSQEYKETLNSVSASIATAVQNYEFGQVA